MECMRFYWFCHMMGTEASRIAARSALLKGILPFFGCNSLGAVLQHREVLQVPIQYLNARYIQTYGSPLGLLYSLLDVELLPFGSIH
jgi:hypothetical protein